MLRSGELIEVFESLLEGLQVLSPDWRYLYVNEQAALHGRTTAEALIGRRIQDCYPGFERTAIFAQMQRCMTERAPTTLENEFRFPDGSIGWFELRIQPVPQGICVLSVDITERKAAEAAKRTAEQRLLDAERADTIGRHAAGAARDFSNYLTLILNVATSALDRQGGARSGDLTTIVELTRSAAQLTRELLTCGASGPFAPRPLDLGAFVAEKQRILLSAVPQRVAASLDIAPTTMPIIADPTQLERVLIQLVSDACAAMPDGGTLRLVVRDEHVRDHPVLPEGPHAVLEVVDTGRELDQHSQRTLFDPRRDRAPDGEPGFGLASVAGIVRQHGGHIEVLRAPVRGSTVRVLLPLAERTAEPVQPERAAPSGAHTILVVDDSPDIGELISRQLRAADHKVLLAASGEDALVLWRQHRDRISLLLTDMMLVGMTGHDLIRRLRADRADLPTLCMSGYLRPESASQEVQFLEKPFTGQELRERVAHLLAGATDAG
ncbi:MAG: PAS domain-containing protein [Planctomycetes bacterium]|nr:PAS domain-containing protein [Planctomycetota bacterium]